jgi:hypothetical protein
MRLFCWYLALFSLSIACSDHPGNPTLYGKIDQLEEPKPEIINDTLIELTNLRRGDILVKPNHNWLPGTTWVKGGVNFGHVMFVLQGATGDNAIDVLSKAIIFESQARNVPHEFEVRVSSAYQAGTDFRYDNVSLSEHFRGYRYRLRPQLSENEIDSLASFLLRHTDGYSSWRALKRFDKQVYMLYHPSQTYWYCSHLIWQAFYTVLNIDLDPNGGLIVFPNDLIASPYFQNDSIYRKKRVRF